MLTNSVVAVLAVAVMGGLLYKLLGLWSSALGGIDSGAPGAETSRQIDPRDLVRAIEETDPAVAKILRQYPFQAVQQRLEFLGDYVSVRITVKEAPPPNVFVAAYERNGKAFVMTGTGTQWDPLRVDLKLKVDVDRTALDLALWYLRAREPDLVPIRRREEVPFLSRLSDDDAARLRDGLKPPLVSALSEGWEVSAVAMRGTVLRRYLVRVAPDAKMDVQGEDWIVAPDWSK